MPITVVLAADHPIILDGLVSLFDREEGLKVVACCRDGEETLRAVRQHQPDGLIVHLRMPVEDGLEVAPHSWSRPCRRSAWRAVARGARRPRRLRRRHGPRRKPFRG